MSSRLESRKLVERAKGLLMSEKGMSEQEAFDYIRKVSRDKRDKNISMRRVSEVIILKK